MSSFFGLADDLRVHGRTLLFDGDAVTSLVLAGPPSVVALHLHERHDELGYLLEGSGTLTIGETTHQLAPGATWAIARNTPHEAEFTSDFRLLSWFTPRDDPDAPDRVELADGAA